MNINTETKEIIEAIDTLAASRQRLCSTLGSKETSAEVVDGIERVMNMLLSKLEEEIK